MTLSKLHYVNVGKDGHFSGDGLISSTPEDIHWMFGELSSRPTPPKRLLLVIHGGLVDEARALGGIHRVHDALAVQGIHPIYLVWETGILDIIRDVVEEEGRKGWFKKALEYLLRAIGAKMGGGAGLSAASPFSAEAVRMQMRSATPFAGVTVTPPLAAAADDSLAQSLQAMIKADMDQGDMAVFEMPEELRTHFKRSNAGLALGPGWLWVVKALVRISIRCIERFTARRDHGFYLTLVEELLREVFVARLGGRVWGEMKERAEEMWRANDSTAPSDLHAGRTFLESLAAYQRTYPGVTIDIAGHSAGAVATCELLKVIAAEQLALKLRHLFLMAPACTTKLFHEAVGQFQPGLYWQSVKVFTMTDQAERADTLIPFLYPASLLYAISGILEDEADAQLLGLERHVRGTPPYQADPVAQFLHEPGRLVLTPTDPSAPEGARCQAVTHAGFADDAGMVASLVHHVAVPATAPAVAAGSSNG